MTELEVDHKLKVKLGIVLSKANRLEALSDDKYIVLWSERSDLAHPLSPWHLSMRHNSPLFLKLWELLAFVNCWFWRNLQIPFCCLP